MCNFKKYDIIKVQLRQTPIVIHLPKRRDTMAQRVKCKELGCEMCRKGKILKKTHLGSIYYCKVSKQETTRRSAKECMGFRCKTPNYYFCKNCNGGKKVGK